MIWTVPSFVLNILTYQFKRKKYFFGHELNEQEGRKKKQINKFIYEFPFYLSEIVDFPFSSLIAISATMHTDFPSVWMLNKDFNKCAKMKIWTSDTTLHIFRQVDLMLLKLWFALVKSKQHPHRQNSSKTIRTITRLFFISRKLRR